MAFIINIIAARTLLIFYSVSFLFIEDGACDTITNLTKKLSCSVFHGEIENTFSWSTQQKHNFDIVLFESKPGTFINCFLQNNETITSQDLSVLLNTTGPNNLRLNSSKISNFFAVSDNSLVMNFQKYYLQMKTNTTVKYEIIFFLRNSSQMLLKGYLTRLGKLPSFSLNSFKRTSLVETVISGNKNWKFLKPPCHHDVVIILPKHLGVAGQGFPLGIAYKSQKMITILKWENVTLAAKLSVLAGKMKSIVLDKFLLLYNEKELYLMPMISEVGILNSIRNFTEAVSSIVQISDIISVSTTAECLHHRHHHHQSWFDLVILVRLTNSTVRAILGKEPYQSWMIYALPDWLSSAQYLNVEIDLDRVSIIVIANVGQPQRSIVTVYVINPNSRDLRIETTPFFLHKALQSPTLKHLPAIPAVIIYDKVEVWLSTDAGHTFRRIFIAPDDDNIERIEIIGLSKQLLAIQTKNSLFEYRSKGLKKYQTDTNCQSSNLLYVNEFGAPQLFCGDSVINSTLEAKNLVLQLENALLPSFIADFANDFEVLITLPPIFLLHEEFKHNVENLCNIPNYPNLHHCDSKRRFNNSFLMKADIGKWMQKAPNCVFELKQVNVTKYTIEATSQEQTVARCELWTPHMIGQTFHILSLRTLCWIYWLQDQRIAWADCSNSALIGQQKSVSSIDAVILESRGDERCFMGSFTLIGTNSKVDFEIKADNLEHQQMLRNASFVRFVTSVGKAYRNGSKLLAKFLPNAIIIQRIFNYTCILSHNTSSDGLVKGITDQINVCQFTVAYDNLLSTNLSLDANDELGFNVTIMKKITNYPYTDSLPPLAIQPIEPSFIKIRVKSYLRSNSSVVRVLLKQKSYRQGTTILNFHATTQPMHCGNSHRKITIHGACPPGKRLVFEYPHNFTRHTWLYGNPKDHEGFTRIATIPYNYQPPSSLGIAIPLTSNIYNADPSKPMHRASYKVSRELAKFKQCLGKLSRRHCGCTDDMTISSLPNHSDCIQRAYKIHYREKFTPRLFIVDSKYNKRKLAFPYCIIEINDRVDWYMNDFLDGVKCVPSSSYWRFYGSGLFHVDVKVLKSGYTFCDLRTHFIFFIADAPILYPAETIVRVMTAFCFGSIILCVFLLNFHLK